MSEIGMRPPGAAWQAPGTPRADVERALALPVVAAVVYATGDHDEKLRRTVATLLAQTWPRVAIVLSFDANVRPLTVAEVVGWVHSRDPDARLPGDHLHHHALAGLPYRWLPTSLGSWTNAISTVMNGRDGRTETLRSGVESVRHYPPESPAPLFVLLDEGQELEDHRLEHGARLALAGGSTVAPRIYTRAEALAFLAERA